MDSLVRPSSRNFCLLPTSSATPMVAPMACPHQDFAEPPPPTLAGRAGASPLSAAESSPIRAPMMRCCSEPAGTSASAACQCGIAPARSPAATAAVATSASCFSRTRWISAAHEGQASAEGGSSVPHRSQTPGVALGARSSIVRSGARRRQGAGADAVGPGHVQHRRHRHPPRLEHAEHDDRGTDQAAGQRAEDDEDGSARKNPAIIARLAARPAAPTSSSGSDTAAAPAIWSVGEPAPGVPGDDVPPGTSDALVDVGVFGAESSRDVRMTMTEYARLTAR